MQDDLRARLMTAADAGEIVRVVYRRGSQPGALREIAPITITDDEVWARDLAAGIDKSFKLAFLELAGPQTMAPLYDPSSPAVEDTRTVRGALESHVPMLLAMGWHVELTENRVSLHRSFKNGRPRKGYEVTLAFDQFTVDMFDDFDGRGLQTVTRPSKRPYNVSSRNLLTRTFVRLSAALPVFMEEARSLAPRDAAERSERIACAVKSPSVGRLKSLRR